MLGEWVLVNTVEQPPAQPQFEPETLDIIVLEFIDKAS